MCTEVSRWHLTLTRAFPPVVFWSPASHQGFPSGSAREESARNVGDLGSIPGLGRSPREGKGCPLQYSALGVSMDCIVHSVTKSQTQLSDFDYHCQPPNSLAAGPVARTQSTGSSPLSVSFQLVHK